MGAVILSAGAEDHEVTTSTASSVGQIHVLSTSGWRSRAPQMKSSLSASVGEVAPSGRSGAPRSTP